MNKYRVAMNRAERVQRSIVERARVLCNEAGLDGGLLGIHPHNAMVGYNNGHPWPEVDYNKVRKVMYLLDYQFTPTRLVHKWAERVRKEKGLDAYYALFQD